MKNNIKHILCLLAVALIGLFSFSCSDSDSKDEQNEIAPPNEKFEAKIYFVSKLNNAPIASTAAEYKVITDFLKLKKTEVGKRAFLGIIDRADATYSAANMKNGSIRTAFEADYCSVFALNKFDGNNIQGSTLLFHPYIKEQQSIKVTNDCYVKAVNAKLYGTNDELEGNKVVSFDMMLRTARFDSQDQVKVFTESVFEGLKNSRINMFMVGTVKKELVESLKEGIKKTDDRCQLTVVPGTESAEYSIFTLAHEQFWLLRGATKQSLANNIDVYELSLMW